MLKRAQRGTVRTILTPWLLLSNHAALYHRPGHDIVGKVHVKQIYEIAKMMMRNKHLSHLPHESVAKCVAGSCISMGLEVVRD